MTECCLAAPSKYRAGDDDGPSDGRVGREVVLHEGDAGNVACKYEVNRRHSKREGPPAVVEKPYRIADGPFRNGCLKQENGSKGKRERAIHGQCATNGSQGKMADQEKEISVVIAKE